MRDFEDLEWFEQEEEYICPEEMLRPSGHPADEWYYDTCDTDSNIEQPLE